MFQPGTTGLGQLSPGLSAKIQGAIASGSFPATALDPKILSDLAQLPEHMASVVIDRFLSSNMGNIRNPSAFLVGVMNRFKAEVQQSGGAVPPVAPGQVLGLHGQSAPLGLAGAAGVVGAATGLGNGGNSAASSTGKASTDAGLAPASASSAAPAAAQDVTAVAKANLTAVGFNPGSVLSGPGARQFGAYGEAAALMGAMSVTSTGVPQNQNPHLAAPRGAALPCELKCLAINCHREPSRSEISPRDDRSSKKKTKRAKLDRRLQNCECFTLSPRLLAPSKTIHVGNLNVRAGVDIELIDRANFAGRPPPQALESGPLGSPALGELAKGARHDQQRRL